MTNVDKYKLDYALYLASIIHKLDRRKNNGECYYLHIERVVNILKKYTDDEDILCAAACHDLVEDHPDKMSLYKIKELFNERVSQLVDDLTNKYTKGVYPELNREDRKHLENIRLGTVCDDSKLIKAADRLDNIQSYVRDQVTIPNYVLIETVQLIS